MLVPTIITDVSTLSPIINPPHRAPPPIDEIVEEPDTKSPSTVIVTESEILKDTPSFIVNV